MQTVLNGQDKDVHTGKKNQTSKTKKRLKNSGMHILQLPLAKGTNIICLSSYLWLCTGSSFAAIGSHWCGYLD